MSFGTVMYSLYLGGHLHSPFKASIYRAQTEGVNKKLRVFVRGGGSYYVCFLRLEQAIFREQHDWPTINAAPDMHESLVYTSTEDPVISPVLSLQ